MIATKLLTEWITLPGSDVTKYQMIYYLCSNTCCSETLPWPRREKLSSGLPTSSCSNHSAQQQRLARMLKLCIKQVKISYFA